MHKISFYLFVIALKVCGATDFHAGTFALINFEGGKFLISKYETTVKLWNEVAAESDSFNFDDFEIIHNDNFNAPVAGIEFNEMCRWLNLYSEINKRDPCFYVGGTVYRKSIEPGVANSISMKIDKNGFRLPLEVEWDRAHVLAFPSELSKSFDVFGVWNYDGNFQEYEWFQGNSNGLVKEIGLKKSNAWGGFDFAGNVSEFCFDDFKGGNQEPGSAISKVVKGGSVILSSRHCSREFRRGIFGKSPYIGFRWVISVTESEPFLAEQLNTTQDTQTVSPTPSTKNSIPPANSGAASSPTASPAPTFPKAAPPASAPTEGSPSETGESGSARPSPRDPR